VRNLSCFCELAVDFLHASSRVCFS
jgi:hypothetical protein